MAFRAKSKLGLARLSQGSGGFFGGQFPDQAEVAQTLLQLAQALGALAEALSSGGGPKWTDSSLLTFCERVLQKLRVTYNNVINNRYTYLQLLQLGRFVCSLRPNLAAGVSGDLGGFGGSGNIWDLGVYEGPGQEPELEHREDLGLNL